MVMNRPGPAVIKLLESENELKCKNRLHDFIETLCIFSKFCENYLRDIAMFLLFSRNSYGKILENFLKFYDGRPGTAYIMHKTTNPFYHSRI